jgi:hypothetical protein
VEENYETNCDEDERRLLEDIIITIEYQSVLSTGLLAEFAQQRIFAVSETLLKDTKNEQLFCNY